MKLAIGARYRCKLETTLQHHNVKVIWLPDNTDVDERLSGHADLSVFCAENTVIAANEAYPCIVNSLTFDGSIFRCSAKQCPAYPKDASLCVCHTGKYMIYNPRTADPIILERIHGIPIETNQGYTKCSVCVVSDDAIITSDDAIASRANKSGMDVLKIKPGHIELAGFDYGFIGGAAFLIGKNKLAFTGVLSAHPDEERILAFLNKYGLEPVFLTNDSIFDIGGAVALP